MQPTSLAYVYEHLCIYSVSLFVTECSVKFSIYIKLAKPSLEVAGRWIFEFILIFLCYSKCGVWCFVFLQHLLDINMCTYVTISFIFCLPLLFIDSFFIDILFDQFNINNMNIKIKVNSESFKVMIVCEVERTSGIR